MQSNASFFLQWSTKHKAVHMLDAGRIHLLGSDCHNMAERPPRVGEALAQIGDRRVRMLERRCRMLLEPEEGLRYEVFAATPFRNYHLLHYFNFGNETRHRAFLQAVDSVRTMDANRNKGVAVTPGDPLLILSTTRAGSSSMSYLVLAKRV